MIVIALMHAGKADPSSATPLLREVGVVREEHRKKSLSHSDLVL